MSIHFRLNSDATILHVERRSAVNNKSHFEPVARFNLYESIYSKKLNLEEHMQAIIFAKQQREEIRQAYSNYMNNQMFGGTPVVSRGEKITDSSEICRGSELEYHRVNFWAVFKVHGS